MLVPLKTASSRRHLPLPELVADALKAHRRRQLEERLAAGRHWQDHDLVFTTAAGTPIDARNLSRQFARLRDQAGLPWLTFHPRPAPWVRLAAGGQGRTSAGRDGAAWPLQYRAHHGDLHARGTGAGEGGRSPDRRHFGRGLGRSCSCGGQVGGQREENAPATTAGAFCFPRLDAVFE